MFNKNSKTMWDNAESPPHEHLWSIQKNLPCFPIMEHFNTAGNSIHDALKVFRSFWSATQIIRIFFRYLFYYFQVFPSLCFKFRLKVHPLIWRSSFIPFLFIYFILFLQATIYISGEHKCLLSKNTHIYMPIPHPHPPKFLSVTLVLQIPMSTLYV